MSFLLRRATYAAWQGVRPASDDQRNAAHADFTLSEADTDGLSLFEVEDDMERRLVVAAIACGRKNTGNIDLLEITDAEIKAFGEASRTPGTSPVARANELHRSLAWEQPTLLALADRLLVRGCQAIRYKKADVKAAVAALVMADVEPGPAREWVATLRSA